MWNSVRYLAWGLFLVNAFQVAGCRTTAPQSSENTEALIIYDDDKIFKIKDDQVLQIVMQESLLTVSDTTNFQPTIGVWLSANHDDPNSDKNTVKIAQIAGPRFAASGQVLSRTAPISFKRQVSRVPENWAWNDVVEIDGANINKRVRDMKSNFIRLSMDAWVNAYAGVATRRSMLATNEMKLDRFGVQYKGKRGGYMIGTGAGDVLTLAEPDQIGKPGEPNTPGREIMKVGFQLRIIDKAKKTTPFATAYAPSLGVVFAGAPNTIANSEMLSIKYRITEHKFPVIRGSGIYRFYSTARITSKGAVVVDLPTSQVISMTPKFPQEGNMIFINNVNMYKLMDKIGKLQAPKIQFEIWQDGDFLAGDTLIVSESIDMQELVKKRTMVDNYSPEFNKYPFKLEVEYKIYK